MMSKQKERARQMFTESSGILRWSEAIEKGIHPQTLSRMVRDGILERMERGIYRLKEGELHGGEDLVAVSKLVPKGVMCLLTALVQFDMTSQIPRKVYVALPKGAWKPELEYPQLEIFRMSGKAYESGVIWQDIEGERVPFYNREKTVADCFKFRGRIGEDIAIEALKEYLRKSNRNMNELLQYAAINRVEDVMSPYLRALL
jgi:predicted transcriptional regulator of viral defense system